jgi:hypothetical protein
VFRSLTQPQSSLTHRRNQRVADAAQAGQEAYPTGDPGTIGVRDRPLRFTRWRVRVKRALNGQTDLPHPQR